MPSSYLSFAILFCVIGSPLVLGDSQHQIPLLSSKTVDPINAPVITPPQHGRFLHLTDIHVSEITKKVGGGN
ncbi:hypothetical protein BC941DRAFT_407248 [Chlamydoabsidia padenii]|nr:hypothetical protein BC941DRAFT_407248 [Chlamydoabsidia padenii]